MSLKNNILHCGICGKPLDIQNSSIEIHPIVKNPKGFNIIDCMKAHEAGKTYTLSDYYGYVKLVCYCQYHNKQIFEYYLTALEWYLLLEMIKNGY